MRLDQLSLTSFRNYERLDEAWRPEGALLWGENGAGKSNLLEAIHLLSVGRSHRTQSDRELIAIGADALWARGDAESEAEGRVDVEIGVRVGGPKQARVNGKDENRLSAIVGRIGMVVIAPEDMEITRGAPQRRRRFLDQLLCQIQPAYLVALQSYGRALRQRNVALREARDGIGSLETARSWDGPLIEWGNKVRAGRAALTERVADLAREQFGEVSDRTGRLEIGYPAADDDLAADLARVAESEPRRGMTLAGPHRDDLAIVLDGKDVRSFGSRGQQRAATFALKIASALLFREDRGEAPILLLDDIFAELDRGRRERLGRLLAGSAQVFATATTAEELEARFPGVPPYEVRAGTLAGA